MPAPETRNRVPAPFEPFWIIISPRARPDRPPLRNRPADGPGRSGPETPAGGTGPEKPETSSAPDRRRTGQGGRGRATEARAVLGMAPCHERGWVGHMIRSNPFPVPAAPVRRRASMREGMNRPLRRRDRSDGPTGRVVEGCSRSGPPHRRPIPLRGALRSRFRLPAAFAPPSVPTEGAGSSELIALFLIPETEQIAALVEVLRPPRGQEHLGFSHPW